MRWGQVTVNICYSMDIECSHKDLHVKGMVTEHGNGRGGRTFRNQGLIGEG